MCVAPHHHQARMPQKVRNGRGVRAAFGESTRTGMSEIMPSGVLNARTRYDRGPDAVVKISGIQRGRRILGWKDPFGTLPGIKSAQDRRRFRGQVDVLHRSGFRLWQCHEVPVQTDILPLHRELFGLSEASQNRQVHPRGIGTQFSGERRFFGDAQVTCAPFTFGFPGPVIEQLPLGRLDRFQRRMQPTEVAVDRRSGSDGSLAGLLSSGIERKGSSQLVSNRLEIADSQILHTGETSCSAPGLPPVGKSALASLIFSGGLEGGMPREYVLDPLPAAMWLNFARRWSDVSASRAAFASPLVSYGPPRCSRPLR